MTDYMPYIVSVVSSLVACVTSIVVCLIQINRSKKETSEKIVAEKEAIQMDYEYKIKLLREEYALKAGTQMITDVLNKTVTSVYDAPAVKNAINKKAQQAMMKNNNRQKK